MDAYRVPQHGKPRGQRVQSFVRGVNGQGADPVFRGQAFGQPAGAGYHHRFAVLVEHERVLAVGGDATTQTSAPSVSRVKARAALNLVWLVRAHIRRVGSLLPGPNIGDSKQCTQAPSRVCRIAGCAPVAGPSYEAGSGGPGSVAAAVDAAPDAGGVSVPAAGGDPDPVPGGDPVSGGIPGPGSDGGVGVGGSSGSSFRAGRDRIRPSVANAAYPQRSQPSRACASHSAQASMAA